MAVTHDGGGDDGKREQRSLGYEHDAFPSCQLLGSAFQHQVIAPAAGTQRVSRSGERTPVFIGLAVVVRSQRAALAATVAHLCHLSRVQVNLLSGSRENLAISSHSFFTILPTADVAG